MPAMPIFPKHCFFKKCLNKFWKIQKIFCISCCNFIGLFNGILFVFIYVYSQWLLIHRRKHFNFTAVKSQSATTVVINFLHTAVNLPNLLQGLTEATGLVRTLWVRVSVMTSTVVSILKPFLKSDVPPNSLNYRVRYEPQPNLKTEVHLKFEIQILGHFSRANK